MKDEILLWLVCIASVGVFVLWVSWGIFSFWVIGRISTPWDLASLALWATVTLGTFLYATISD